MEQYSKLNSSGWRRKNTIMAVIAYILFCPATGDKNAFVSITLTGPGVVFTAVFDSSRWHDNSVYFTVHNQPDFGSASWCY